MFCVVIVGRVQRPTVVGPFAYVSEADAYADLRRAEELVYSDGTRVYVERMETPPAEDVRLTVECSRVAGLVHGGR